MLPSGTKATTNDLNISRVVAFCYYLRSSQDSSKAVRIGSLDDNAMSEGEASALYALMRDLECRRESSMRDVTHSSQPHLKQTKGFFD